MRPNLHIVIHCSAPDALVEFWSAALGYEKVGWFEPYFVLVSPVAAFPPVVLERVSPPSAGRLPIDVRTDNVQREVARLERLGAVRVDGDPADDRITMVDPEGNEFGVCRDAALPVPAASVDGLVAAAWARLARVRPQDLDTERAQGALIVDIRPIEQRARDGELPGALVIDRNVLEWRLDPRSDHRIAEISDHDARIVIVCNEGYASSLVAESLHALGLHRATDLAGGYQAWLALGRDRR